MSLLGGGGGSASAIGGTGGIGGTSSNVQDQTVQFQPIFNFGEGNSNEVTPSSGSTTTISPNTEQRNDLTSTASNKDEFGVSAGVAVGSGASASGGPVGIGGGTDVQPVDARYSAPNSGQSDKTPIYIFGGLLLAGAVLVLLKKKKK